ncbi:MAG: alpha/beta hydrolase [Cyanobacteria bacterium J06576_12]
MLTANKTRITHAYDLTDAFTASEADGPTLVFIHGWLLSRAYWEPVIRQLSPYYRCLSYDLRGFGESALLTEQLPSHAEQAQAPIPQITLPFDKISHIEALENKDSEATSTEPAGIDGSKEPNNYTPSQYSLAAYANDLEALLSELNLKNVWLVGHSLGGSIALWAAYLQPERVKGVICVNAGGGIYIPKEFEKFRAAGQQMVKFRPKWLPSFPLLPQLFSRMMVKQTLASSWGKQRLRDFVNADRKAAEGALLESTTKAEVHLLPRIVKHLSQPVHFITATNDTIMPPRYVRHLASFHPQFEEEQMVSEIAECGHMAMVEQPEAVAETVRSVISNAAISNDGADAKTRRERGVGGDARDMSKTGKARLHQ